MHLLPLLFTFLAFAQDNPGADDVFKALELPATNIQEDLKEVLSDQKPKTFRFKFQEVSKVCSVLKSNVHLSKPRYSKTIMRHKKFHVDVYGQMSNVEKFAKYKPQII